MGIVFSEAYWNENSKRKSNDCEQMEIMLQLHFWDEFCTPFRIAAERHERYKRTHRKGEVVIRTSSGCSRRGGIASGRDKDA